MEKLTIREAFDAMTDFLTVYWEQTDSEDIANLLSDMNTELWSDSSTADPESHLLAKLVTLCFYYS